MTVAEMIETLRVLPQDAQIVVRQSNSLHTPLAELRSAGLDENGQPVQLSTAGTPGAVEVVLL